MQHLPRAVLLRPKLRVGLPSGQFRLASSGSPAHGEHPRDSPEAGFFTPFWRNTLLLSLVAVSFYKWAPAQDDDAYLTRWIAHYATAPNTWAQLNEKHMLQSQQVTDNVTVQTKATRPGIIRYRYPQSLEQASPHLLPVGSAPDMSDVAVRTD